jgi:hypothetical protein
MTQKVQEHADDVSVLQKLTHSSHTPHPHESETPRTTIRGRARFAEHLHSRQNTGAALPHAQLDGRRSAAEALEGREVVERPQCELLRGQHGTDNSKDAQPLLLAVHKVRLATRTQHSESSGVLVH